MPMNDLHMQLCASPEWAAYVRDDLIPWATAGWDLGDDVLEIGAGPGLTTDVLRAVAPRLTALEIDEGLAGALKRRLHGTNVTVVEADATASGLPDARFSAVMCFTMLHHVPSPELQDRLFVEVHRVLRAGGVFLGTDGLDTEDRRALHENDVFVPVDPATLGDRLSMAGFADVTVDVVGDRLRFAAARAASR